MVQMPRWVNERQNSLFGHNNWWAETTHLDFRELHNFGKDLDAVGVGDHGVHATAARDGCWDSFQFVPTDIDFFKFLQFRHFTKTKTNPRHRESYL